jgi:cation:H+ antiporter
MSSFEIIVFIVVGLLMLFIGAEGLIRGSTSLALRIGITPLVIGLTVVAFGTSSPELFVSLKASLGGNSDIALGNVIGSNIANIALILGTAALIRPMKVQAQVVRREIPIMIFVSLLLILFLTDGEINRFEGIIFFAGIIVYTVVSIYLARKEKSGDVENEFLESLKRKTLKVWLATIFMIMGLVLLSFGANLLVEGAVEVAKIFGMSKAVIGLTIIAVGTSIPELVTSVVASLKSETDIAIGNVIGSNVFNILLILGVTATIVPISSEGITTVDLVIMMFTAVIILPLSKTGFTLNRLEGALLLSGYIVYIYYLLP